MNILIFFLGAQCGAIVGIFAFCLCRISRDPRTER